MGKLNANSFSFSLLFFCSLLSLSLQFVFFIIDVKIECLYIYCLLSLKKQWKVTCENTHITAIYICICQLLNLIQVKWYIPKTKIYLLVINILGIILSFYMDPKYILWIETKNFCEKMITTQMNHYNVYSKENYSVLDSSFITNKQNPICYLETVYIKKLSGLLLYCTLYRKIFRPNIHHLLLEESDCV